MLDISRKLASIGRIKLRRSLKDKKKKPPEARTCGRPNFSTLSLRKEVKKMNKVQIVPNNRGGFSIKIDCQEIGNYATFADALRIVKLNGFELEEA